MTDRAHNNNTQKETPTPIIRNGIKMDPPRRKYVLRAATCIIRALNVYVYNKKGEFVLLSLLYAIYQ